ncbi:hypothetical protein [Rossellomorea sp. KS-H15a]|uniref:hypothetical protein n=1 Tax=Rossellomorea sp. KS-H15a TaxID=2963940 RepID=UPI0020C6AA11|nr:hypothetical protein [Rossellomorea sp. KS-H15a]UTE77298.1 hypothetical protein M1J35_00170 [Rossellomorea sp. KS-H15a]
MFWVHLALFMVLLSHFFWGIRRGDMEVLWRVWGGIVKGGLEGGNMGSASDFGCFFSRRIIGEIQQSNSKRKSAAE